MNEAEKAKALGEDIVALLRLKPDKMGRYETFMGNKTLTGLGRVVKRLTFKY